MAEPQFTTSLERELHHALLMAAGYLNALAVGCVIDESRTVKFAAPIGTVTLGQVLDTAEIALALTTIPEHEPQP